MLSLVYAYLLHYLLHIPCVGLYKKAGKNPLHAFIPLIQDMSLMEIIGRPKKQAYWGLVPYVNFLFGLTWTTDICNSFGKRSLWQHIVAIFAGFLYFPFLGLIDKNTHYEGPSHLNDREKNIKRSFAREWADAIIFAIVAATIIRSFVIEAYKIPTTSMEGSLLAGDFLFVSKLNYGARTPMTPVAFPFAHHTMPLGLGNAYSKVVQLAYHRLPGFEKVSRNDVVVFNYPGDAYQYPERPLDKRENYVKRCVAIAGDTLQVKHRELYVNSVRVPHYKNMQLEYLVKTNGTPLTLEYIQSLGLNWYNDFPEVVYVDANGNGYPGYSDEMGSPVAPSDILLSQFNDFLAVNKDSLMVLLTETQLAALKKNPQIKSVEPAPAPSVQGAWIYSLIAQYYNWTLDDFGPLVIPAKGWTIDVTNKDNLYRYAQTIVLYEHANATIIDDKLLINGQPVTQYTFKQDYYWMMGDNRHNSLDSRYWGFVPEDHIVGKPLFVWLSKDSFNPGLSSIHWNRMFRSVKSLCE
jgi:signal peptidase I